MSTIPTHTYSNPNFYGSNQAVNSPQINLPYIWDDSLNASQGAWRPTTTGDLLTATIENAQVNVNIEKDEDSVNIYTSQGQSINVRNLSSTTDSIEAVSLIHDNLNCNSNLQISNSDVANSNPVPVSQINTPAYYDPDITDSGTTAARTMFNYLSNGIMYTKHSYCVTFAGGAATNSARIKFQVSNDNTYWNTIEERVANFTNTDNAELTYYDEHNFLHTRVEIELISGSSTCYIREVHSA
jgi:hypothetical protein